AWALRMRVSKSAMVSVTCMFSYLLDDLPACLLHAGDLALVCKLPEADTANAELPKVGMRPAADLAAVVFPGGILLRSTLFDFHRSLGHNNPSLFGERSAHQSQELAGLF